MKLTILYFSNENSLKRDVADAFVTTFQLSPETKNALHGTNKNTTVTPEIFVALDKIKDINQDCRILMQAGCQVLAGDVMEKMNLHQEGALERLYRWTQQCCRSTDFFSNIDLLTECLSRLQDRTVLFKYVLEEYCTVRRSYLVQTFIEALTKGGPDNNPPPIEVHAHDPQKYVGDILAWLNQAILIERDNIHILVEKCNKADITDQVNKALENIVEGVVHPLKIRIEKIVTVSAPSTSFYAVKSLIQFYKSAIQEIIHDGLLLITLNEMLELSENVFLSVLQSQVLTALARVEAPPRNLSPTPAVSHMLVVLNEILTTASMGPDHETDMKKIVSCVLDPVICAINEQASRLPTSDMAVYLLNCMHSMQNTLRKFKHMDDRMERLQGMSEAQLDTLTSEQASSLVANLNLGAIYTILQDQKNEPLSNVPGMEPINLKTSVDKLEVLLEVPDMLLLPQILLLTSTDHRSLIQKRAFEVLVAIYRQLYDAVHNPENGYQNPSVIFHRDPDNLAKALDIK
ncbi:conserved oligomeric Golgi complex subunit 6 isoform X2 [Chrysoperla carnea]|uniref:conserved oligomeric Golgi complex subunit 6 isoform X2 n=1 Tax=Chrysoperla carnea TaxID=189513 RepID=UPI001D087AFC|nr:conserved oligomeric Golgi complex subunit 6 isoform X2 [Chrysoperla carnea]